MEKTAVEFLVESVNKKGLVGLFTREELKQANKMFEQQIINASNESYFNYRLLKRSVENKKVFSVGEQYYNETFNQQ